MKIVAIVPTYNRPYLLIRNIECLLKQTNVLFKIIILDNASEPETKNTLEEKGFLNNPSIIYHRINVNQGASGGFKRAMELAIELEADWVWGMDDDAFPKADALSNLVSFLNKKSDTKMVLWSNCDDDRNFSDSFKNVNSLIFVGFFISKKSIQEIGYPDTRFHMYHDDTDYSQRIIKSGHKIFKIRDLVIEHKGFDKRGEKPFSEYRIFNKTFCIFNFEGYRIYYILRNQFYVTVNTKWDALKYHKFMLINLLKYIVFRPRVSKYVLLAYYHIIIGKRGKVL